MAEGTAGGGENVNYLKESYMERATESRNPDILLTGLQDYTNRILDIVNAGSPNDLPLKLAAINATKNALEQLLSEDGMDMVHMMEQSIQPAMGIVHFPIALDK